MFFISATWCFFFIIPLLRKGDACQNQIEQTEKLCAVLESRLNPPVGRLPTARRQKRRTANKTIRRKDKFLVSGIIQVDGKRGALVRAQVVHEGDAIDGYTIVRIGEQKVEVENEKKEKTTWFLGYS